MAGIEWVKERPENLGLSSQSVLRFIDELEKYGINMHGFSLNLDNRIAAEAYWNPFHSRFQHRMYSVGKSMVALGIGLLEAEGQLHLSDSICRYFPEKLPADTHPYIEAMTIRHLLTMQTAHSSTTYKRSDTDDWATSYDTSATHVMTALIEKLSGLSLMDYLRNAFLDEIGFSKEARFHSDPMGVSQGGSGLVCTQEDIRNLGYLILKKGKLFGKQLLPKAFLRQAISKQVSTDFQPSYDERWGYGFQIWMTRYGGFALYGLGGQLVIGIPEREILFVSTADTQGDPWGTATIHRCFWDILYPVIGRSKVIPRDGSRESSVLELEKKIRGLSVAIPTITTENELLLNNALGQYQFSPLMQKGGLEKLELDREENLLVLKYKTSLAGGQIAFGINQLAQGTLKLNLEEADGPYYGYVAVFDNKEIELTLKRIGDLFAELKILLSIQGNQVSAKIRVYGETSLTRFEGIFTGRIIRK